MNYPFRAGPVFARNQWYIAAWADEIGERPLGRTILGEDIVVYRTKAGEAVALAGMCPHRWMPLAGAPVIDDTIVCPYHGARFDRIGRCARAPLDQRAPPSFALKAYPLVERGPGLWIWMGDAAADLARLPDLASVGLEGPGWRVDVAPPRRLAARAQLLIENLFDQSHIEFVHPSTLGNAAARPDPIATEMVETETRFSVWRTVPPMAADDSSRAVFDGLGDYLMARIRVELLGVSLVNSVGSQTFNATADGQMLDLLGEMNFLHGVTPETATSTHYFTAAARNFARDADGISAALMARNDGVVDQDIAVLEAVERHLDALGDVRAEVTFASDAGAMQVRRRMERILAQDGLVRAA